MARPRKKPPAIKRSPVRATAERIAEWLQPKEQLIDMIEIALLDERKRAARIIKEHRESDRCEGNCWEIITSTIEGNTDE